MNTRKCAVAAALVTGLASTVFSTTASATLLTSSVSVDNGYVLYISTNNATAGTSFSAGNAWTTTYTGSTTLAAGTDYYLHVYAYDQGGIAGFLGDFSLTGTDHIFSNGLTSLQTNATNWLGNNTGFSSAYGALTDLGQDGVSPWGNRAGISDTAHWIWAGNAYDNNFAYFTTVISAVQANTVPEPGTAALIGLGLLGFGLSKRRKT